MKSCKHSAVFMRSVIIHNKKFNSFYGNGNIFAPYFLRPIDSNEFCMQQDVVCEYGKIHLVFEI